jgi:hypothetical protein
MANDKRKIKVCDFQAALADVADIRKVSDGTRVVGIF